MLAILNSLNAHNFPIFQPILMILVSKFMVRRALLNKTYLFLGLLSPLILVIKTALVVTVSVPHMANAMPIHMVKTALYPIIIQIDE